MRKEDMKEELDELHAKALELFKKAEEGWVPVRKRALDDQCFYLGDQWDEDLLKVAKLRREPSLKVNRLPVFVKQIENELRQREMAINVHPLDQIGSADTAEIFSSMIRAIEQRSHAKSHYIYAAGENGALVPGFGYLKLVVDYDDGNSFDQVVRIASVKDPMKVLPDPTALEPDFSDAEYWFEFEDYPEETFKRLWPMAECSSVGMFPIGARQSQWIGEQGIRVARFWYKEERIRTYFLLDDGTIAEEESVDSVTMNDGDDDQDDEALAARKVMTKDGKVAVVLRHREVISHKIKWCDFSGAEILEEGEWAGDFFPYVAVTGAMTVIDGERDIRGIIRNAKDSQKMLNYMASSAARRIASANKSPWLVDMASIKPYETMWKTSNTENWAYLPYNSRDPNGNGEALPPPVRADQTGQINDLLNAAAKFENDLKSTVGIYDAGLGATPNEQSGIAIKTLAQQGANSNYHFSDNLVRSLQRLGTCLVNIIPKIYDTPRIVRAVGADSQQKVVTINQLFEEGGKQKLYNLTEGSYGCTVNAGPAYATQKQAAIEQILELCRVNPNITPYVQDVIAGTMDFPGKELIRDRLLKVLAMTSPALIEGTPEADMPPQAIAMLTQQKQMIEQMTQEMQQLQMAYTKLDAERQAKLIEHSNDMELQQAKTADEMALEAQRAKNEKELTALQALREDQDNLRKQELEHIKIQLDNTNQTMKHILDLVKVIGPHAASQVVKDLDTSNPGGNPSPF